MSNVSNQLPGPLHWKPANLPRWPKWSGRRQQITLSGWHLTPKRGRLAHFLAEWSTRAALIFPLVHCWEFKNIPGPLRSFVIGFMSGQWTITEERLKWAYFCLWLMAIPLYPLWREIFYTVFAAALVKRTTIRFTASDVRIHRFGRRTRIIPRDPGSEMTFVLSPHPRLPWLELKAKDNARLIVFYHQIRFLSLQTGKVLLPITGFVSVEAAQQFSTLCSEALSYRLHVQSNSPETSTAERNAPDV
jgi:hypothetical protein